MPTDTPQATGDESLVVVFVILGVSPSGLLSVGDNFKEERASKKAESGEVADA
jgi:hypothetical protein